MFIKLLTFVLFITTYNAFKFTNYVNYKLKIGNELHIENKPNIYNDNNKHNIMTDNFIYIISHHYNCDDYFYQPYCDLYRVYQTDNEAFQEIYNIYNNKYDDNYHFKVVKYRINKINEDEQLSEVLYDSYKHIINEKLEVINREIEKKEEFLQVSRLYNWALCKSVF
jgi:hypothetical protein